jgi:hypothetical protein
VGIGKRVGLAFGAGAGLTLTTMLVWTRGFTRLDEIVEEQRPNWSRYTAKPPSKPVVIAATTAAGGLYYAPYGVVRPLLPRRAAVAGAIYGVVASLASGAVLRTVRSHYGLAPSPRPSPRRRAGYAAQGALIASAAGRADST